MTAETAPTVTRTEPNTAAAPAAPFVPQPATVEETGVDLALLVDLTLKVIHFSGRPSGRQLADLLALPFAVTEELIAFARREQAVEIVGSSGVGEQAYEYALTGRGLEKVDAALQRNQYAGPAPVPFSLYVDVLPSERQDFRLSCAGQGQQADSCNSHWIYALSLSGG